ncbi:MAG: hypothetical protein EXX96DRAFT_653467 [Benjaminiella poitrasii]|nr:MAG: hypothetical protein EXX96DRAFT_653467 [Benjaminiella poitrasii]
MKLNKDNNQQPVPSYPRPLRDTQQDQQRTIIACGHTPIPVKGVQRALAKKCIVILVDEFRTSIRCSHCAGELYTVQSERKKKHKSDRQYVHPPEKKACLKCLDDENHILHTTSTCPDRPLSEQGRTIYPLKLCSQCLVNNNNPLYWNRDVNAAANIRTILVNYIISKFNIDSRPTQLSKRREDNFEA